MDPIDLPHLLATPCGFPSARRPNANEGDLDLPMTCRSGSVTMRALGTRRKTPWNLILIDFFGVCVCACFMDVWERPEMATTRTTGCWWTLAVCFFVSPETAWQLGRLPPVEAATFATKDPWREKEQSQGEATIDGL